MARRSHPKIEDLPQELREAVHKKITEGYTYRDIADWITKQGHGISKSAIGKYGKNFLSKLERLRVAREQAKTIVAEAKNGPALEMTEAANQMAVQIILERLINMDDLENLYEWGCDGVITNYPDVCKSWLKAKKAKG